MVNLTKVLNMANIMKQNKNTIFCYGCHKHKMLFESQAKAENFIKYNSDGILEENGKAPVRSYYCKICGGWHVTSIPYSSVGKSLDRRDTDRIEKLEQYNKAVEQVKAITAVLTQRIMKIRGLLVSGKTEEAEDLLEICMLDLDELQSYSPILHSNSKTTTLRARVRKMYEMLDSIKNNKTS